MFRQGDTVRLTAFHRGEDHDGVVVELNHGRRLVVAGHVTGSPDVRCRFPERPSRTVPVPAAKLACVRAADDPDADDGDHTGGGPVGELPEVEVAGVKRGPYPLPGRKGYPPARRCA